MTTPNVDGVEGLWRNRSVDRCEGVARPSQTQKVDSLFSLQGRIAYADDNNMHCTVVEEQGLGARGPSQAHNVDSFFSLQGDIAHADDNTMYCTVVEQECSSFPDCPEIFRLLEPGSAVGVSHCLTLSESGVNVISWVAARTGKELERSCGYE